MTRPVRAFSLLTAAFHLAGCSWFTSGPVPDPPLPEECTGRYYLVVQNPTRFETEIVQNSRDSGRGTVIAVLPPGRHEIDIPARSGLYYTARHSRKDGDDAYQSPIGGPGSRQRFRSIQLKPTCAEAKGTRPFGG